MWDERILLFVFWEYLKITHRQKYKGGGYGIITF